MNSAICSKCTFSTIIPKGAYTISSAAQTIVGFVSPVIPVMPIRILAILSLMRSVLTFMGAFICPSSIK